MNAVHFLSTLNKLYIVDCDDMLWMAVHLLHKYKNSEV